MDLFDAIWIAILQGATELFPVSSLGHAVVVPALIGTGIDQRGEAFLPFLVLLHLGTATALIGYFWRDWWDLARGTLGLADAHVVAESRRVLLLIVIATIPAVILGGLLEHRLRLLFGSPAIVAGFLVANGLMLLLAERLRGRAARAQKRPLSSLRTADALAIGCWQCLALLPGLSRSGATIVGGLLRGLDHEAAAHFSFLIATPIILGATVLEVPKLLHEQIAPGTLEVAGIAAVVAGITALASTWLLMRLFRANDTWSLVPFGVYCLVFGAAALALLGVG